MKKKIFPLIISVLLSFWMITVPLSSQGGKEDRGSEILNKAKEKGGNSSMTISSSVFEEGGTIPVKYSCDGEDISPPLSWSDAPENTKSFALISDDPDAPMGTWVHWVIYNIPGSSSGLEENVPTDKTLSDGSVQGSNSWDRIGYGGPCPPGGTHRYYFKLYALDTELDLGPGASKKELERAMKDHVLAEDQLMGRFSR